MALTYDLYGYDTQWRRRRRPLVGVRKTSEAISYQMSTGAAQQAVTAWGWADRAGQVEIALHPLGDAARRQVLTFACGLQVVSPGLCRTLPEGVMELVADAQQRGLNVLGQAHHHPFYGRPSRRRVSHFLSVTDYELLEQLLEELASTNARIDHAFRPARVALRTGEQTTCEVGDRRYRLRAPADTEIEFSDVRVRRSTATVEVFVAATGSDYRLYGDVLRGVYCSECAGLQERSLHPLELQVSDEGLAPEFTEQHFDEQRWLDELEEKVRVGYRARSVSRPWRRKTRTERGKSEVVTVRTSQPRRHRRRRVVSQLERRLDRLERLLEDVPDARRLMEDVRSLVDEIDTT